MYSGCEVHISSLHRAHTEVQPSLGQPNSSSNHNVVGGRICSESYALPSAVSLKRKVGTEPSEELITASHPKTQRLSKAKKVPPKTKKDAQLVQSTTLWLKDGLEKLAVDCFPTLVTLSDISLSQLKDEACTLADHLWELLNGVENESAAVVWLMRYIATCALVVGIVFTSPSKEGLDVGSVKATRQNVHNWQGLVHIVNSIVNTMLLQWENKAYLIYHAFAVKGHLLSGVALKSEARRELFALEVANALGPIAPSGFEGVPLFNPTRVLSCLLRTKSHEEICKAIWLPSAINTIRVESSIVLFPNMATLSRRVKDLSVLPAQVKSGNISSPPGLSPPPIPTTFQLEYSTGTGEKTECCNTERTNHFTQSSTATTNIGANLSQVGDWRPSHPTCGAVSLAPVTPAETLHLTQIYTRAQEHKVLF